MALSSFVRSRVSASQLPLAIVRSINLQNQSRRGYSDPGSVSDVPKFTRIEGSEPYGTISFESKQGDKTVHIVVCPPYGSVANPCFEMDVKVSHGPEHDKSLIEFEACLFPDQVLVHKVSLTNIKENGLGYLKLLSKLASDRGVKLDLHNVLKDFMEFNAFKLQDQLNGKRSNLNSLI